MPLIAEVLLPLPLPPFSYLVPFGSEAGPVGGRVVVPWQGALRTGICTAIREAPLAAGLELKELTGWLDSEPHLTAGAVQLLTELASHAAVPQGLILAPFVPSGLEAELEHEVQLQEPTLLAPDLEPATWLPAGSVGPELIEALRSEGLLLERVAQRARTQRQLMASAGPAEIDDLPAGSKLRTALTELLKGPLESAAELARRAGVSSGTVRGLITRGLARYEELPAPDPELELPPALDLPAPTLAWPASGDVSLVGGQRRQRLAELLPLLLDEVNRGLSPLVLAPEVSVLNETVASLRGHLPVLPLKGDMSDAERELVWRRAASGGAQVLVTSAAGLLIRSRRPGSLVLLESASSSWKQLSGARLFIPEAARRLARIEQRRLVETEVFLNAELKTLGLQQLQLPPVVQRVHVSDLAAASSWPLDADMSRVLRQVQERGRQAILLSSRRGFSGALTCAACGTALPCPNCDLPLRYHQKEGLLRCHQCNHSESVPERCPVCQSDELQPSRAAGTQWLASGVARLLSGFPVVSYDADSRTLPQELLDGRPGVLVATTAAFRLPPLPNVSLIGVTLFDAHLSQSDFRAAEETLRLLLQLPELSSKPRPLVLMQSFQPGHPVLAVLQRPDLADALTEFTDATLARRRAFQYPPFSHLARIEVSARDWATAESEASRLRGALLASGATEFEVLGPTPAQVARVRGRFVWQLLLRCSSRERLAELLQSMPGSQKGARVRTDVDPRGAGLQLD